MITVLVLGGGPDAEREVSLVSSRSVASALEASGKCRVEYRVIDRPGASELASMPGDVVFPVLHGHFGEGGPLQDLLESGGRAYVGCGPRAARGAMDKVFTKSVAASLGIRVSPTAILDPRDVDVPLPLPVVVKPVHDGSSVGLHLCRTGEEWARARAAVSADLRSKPERVYLVERLLKARELTAGLLDGEPLPLIEIRPAAGVYDYQAKYHRDDTRYMVGPELPAGVSERVRADASRLARALGVRHLARVDFLLDESGEAWLLEVNTMPGFTEHSLLPMAAGAVGLGMPALTWRLVELALRDRGANNGGGSGVTAGGARGHG